MLSTRLKLKGPYTKLIERALKAARTDTKETSIYLKRNNMKVIKIGNGTFTDDLFINGGFEDIRRYLNIRLRNRTEELLSGYFGNGMLYHDRTTKKN